MAGPWKGFDMNATRLRDWALCGIFLLLTGFGSSPPLRDARFIVTGVSLSGPGSIANGRSATYTLNISIQRTGPAQNSTIVGTSGTPKIRPSLYAGDRQLTFREIDFGPNQNSATVNLTLSCSGNEVKGDREGSGAGARAGTGFLGWPWWDSPASVRGKLNEQKSASLKILCGG
jgi:hypothetical protein